MSRARRGSAAFVLAAVLVGPPLLAAGLGWPVPSCLGLAAAEERSAVAVVAVSTPEDAAAVTAVRGIRDAVDRHPRLRAVDVAAYLSGGEGGLEDGRVALEEGEAAYNDLDLEVAAERLERAVVILISAGAPGRADAIKAAALLARVHGASRAIGRMGEDFRLLLRLDPEYSLDERSTPPSMRRAFEDARTANEDAGEASLEITSEPVPGWVRLDGVPVCATPCTLKGVVEGPHIVAVDADGYRNAARRVHVGPDGGRARLSLEGARRATLFARIVERLPEQLESDEAGAALDDLRGLLVADQAVLVESDGEAVEAHLYDLRRGLRVRVASGTSAAPEQIVAALYADVDPRRLVAEVDAAMLGPGAAVEPREKAFYEEWWFYAAAGAGIIAIVTTAVLVSGDDPPEGIGTQDDAGTVLLRF